MRPTDTGRGYWILNSDGEVLPFGDAAWWGELDVAGNERAVDLAIRHH